jgi:VanZ family protein
MILLKYFKHIYPALLWTIIIFILLALPGNMLPSEKGFSIPNFDKVVHIILFGGFVFLWSLYYSFRPLPVFRLRRKFFFLFIVAVLYGTAMEYVQKYFIPFRDYDTMDILADSIGAFLAFLFALFFLVGKKRGLAGEPKK